MIATLDLALRVALEPWPNARASILEIPGKEHADGGLVTFKGYFSDTAFSTSFWSARDVLAWLLVHPGATKIPWWANRQLPNAKERVRLATEAIDHVKTGLYPDIIPPGAHSREEVEHALLHELHCGLLEACLPNANVMRQIDRQIHDTTRGLVIAHDGFDEEGLPLPHAWAIVYLRNGTLEHWTHLSLDPNDGRLTRTPTTTEEVVKALLTDQIVASIENAVKRKIDQIQRSMDELYSFHEQLSQARS